MMHCGPFRWYWAIRPDEVALNALELPFAGVDVVCGDLDDGVLGRVDSGGSKSKTRIRHLPFSLAADFIRDGTRANAICPGTIQSPSLNERIEALSTKTGKPLQAIRSYFIERQPIRRLGITQEVASLAVFLASGDANYITGQTHLVDGGRPLSGGELDVNV